MRITGETLTPVAEKQHWSVSEVATYVAGGGYEGLAVAILLRAARDGDSEFLRSAWCEELCRCTQIPVDVWCRVFEAVSQ